MSESDVNEGRRRFLIGATSAVGTVGAVGVAIPFVGSWNPSAKAKAAGAPVKANISKLEPGQRITVEWRGKPVWIVKRTPEMLETLEPLNGVLKDPDSTASKQPGYAGGHHRSTKPEIAVLVGICTHLGCSPQYIPDMQPQEFDAEWQGGFFCPCHGSKFDIAGRVYSGAPATSNLEVPPYKYVDDENMIIGVDEESA